MTYQNTQYSSRFSIILPSLILIFVLLAGCTGKTSANNNDPSVTEPDTGPDLITWFDRDDLWTSSRDLGAAIIKDSDKFESPGLFSFFRFAYMTGFAGADKLAAAMKSSAGRIESPDIVSADPQSAIAILDDLYATKNLKPPDDGNVWGALETGYGALDSSSIGNLNSSMAVDQSGAVGYAVDGAGFFSGVDHQAYVLGITSLYGLDYRVNFSSTDELLKRYENAWDELPLDAEGNADLIGLMEMYDVVTFPYVLDLAYRETGESSIYYAFADLMSMYADAIDPETLYDRVDASSNKADVLRQLCDLSRLFRRMLAFIDDDKYEWKGESILESIGDLCLISDGNVKLAYTKALITFEEAALHVVITGPSDDEMWATMAHMTRNRYDPRLALMPLDNERDAELIEMVEYYGTKEPKSFVCVDDFCYSPAKDIEGLNEVYIESEKEFVKMRDRKNKEVSEDQN